MLLEQPLLSHTWRTKQGVSVCNRDEQQARYADVRRMSDEIVTVGFPLRWTTGKSLPYAEAVADLDRLGRIIVKGTDAICGVYMRICDTVRTGRIPESEVRTILARYFPGPRISEILCVSRAPEEVYHKYTAGFFGFKSALKHCRLYNITPSEELKRRQAKRAANRLLMLLGAPSEIEIKSHIVTIV